MNYQISHNLKCEIDGNIDDRRREPPHCHITKRGSRVAYVVLEPYVVVKGSDGLDRNEETEVYNFCVDNRGTLVSEYKSGI